MEKLLGLKIKEFHSVFREFLRILSKISLAYNNELGHRSHLAPEALQFKFTCKECLILKPRHHCFCKFLGEINLGCKPRGYSGILRIGGAHAGIQIWYLKSVEKYPN